MQVISLLLIGLQLTASYIARPLPAKACSEVCESFGHAQGRETRARGGDEVPKLCYRSVRTNEELKVKKKELVNQGHAGVCTMCRDGMMLCAVRWMVAGL